MNDPARDIIVTILILFSALFILLAAIALVRLPDVYTRMHGMTKATTLGIGILMVAVGLHLGEIGGSIKAIVFIVFLFITQPIAAQMISRAAYLTRVPMADGHVKDDLAGHYKPDGSELDPHQVFEEKRPPVTESDPND